jgi:hypothetical protein
MSSVNIKNTNVESQPINVPKYFESPKPLLRPQYDNDELPDYKIQYTDPYSGTDRDMNLFGGAYANSGKGTRYISINFILFS